MILLNRLGNLGKNFKSVCSHLFISGSSGSNNPNYAFNFGRVYPDAAKLCVTITLNNRGFFADSFVATIRSISTAFVYFNVYRVDSNGGWGASLEANIVVFELP